MFAYLICYSILSVTLSYREILVDHSVCWRPVCWLLWSNHREQWVLFAGMPFPPILLLPLGCPKALLTHLILSDDDIFSLWAKVCYLKLVILFHRPWPFVGSPSGKQGWGPHTLPALHSMKVYELLRSSELFLFSHYSGSLSPPHFLPSPTDLKGACGERSYSGTERAVAA